MIFNETKPTNSTLELTSTLAQEIYVASTNYKNASAMFNADTGFDWTNVKKVFVLSNKVVADIDKVMNGRIVISEAVYELNEETGENTLVTPIVYLNATTIKNVTDNVTSLLDVSVVLTDYMQGKTFTQFKATYTQV